MNKNVMTEENYQSIKEKIRKLEKENEEITDRLRYARLDGDLSENADWIALNESLESSYVKINRFRSLLENSEIIKEGDKSDKEVIVKVGSKVTYNTIDEFGRVNGEETEVEITSEVDSDHFFKRISYHSPLGSSLIGRKIKDVVEIFNPKSFINYKIKILKIK